MTARHGDDRGGGVDAAKSATPCASLLSWLSLAVLLKPLSSALPDYTRTRFLPWANCTSQRSICLLARTNEEIFKRRGPAAARLLRGYGGRIGPTWRHSSLSVDHGGEEFGLHELIDSLETLAIPAIAVAGVALVMQQSFQIVSKLVHDREFIEAEACGVAGPRPDHSLSLTFPTSTNASLKEHWRRRKRMFGSLR